MNESFDFEKVSIFFAAERVQSWALKLSTAIALVALCVGTGPITAWGEGVSNNCAGLPGNAALRNALTHAVFVETSGLDLNMWATIVARDGTVCAVAFSGTNSGSQ